MVYVYVYVGNNGEMWTEEIKNKNALPKTPGLSSGNCIPDTGDEEVGRPGQNEQWGFQKTG